MRVQGILELVCFAQDMAVSEVGCRLIWFPGNCLPDCDESFIGFPHTEKSECVSGADAGWGLFQVQAFFVIFDGFRVIAFFFLFEDFDVQEVCFVAPEFFEFGGGFCSLVFQAHGSEEHGVEFPGLLIAGFFCQGVFQGCFCVWQTAFFNGVHGVVIE